MADDEFYSRAYYFCKCANNYLAHLLKEKDINIKRKIIKRRKCWMIAMHKNRTRASMEKLFGELRSEIPGQFFNFFPMSGCDFEYLLNKIGPSIAKRDTRFRKSIPAKIRLVITLRFLATGESFRSLHYLFKVSHQQISGIVTDVCEALIINLKEVVQLPLSQEDWLGVAHELEDVFPHCIGALDGKHVRIVSPYLNYQTFSIILMTLVDRNFCFLFADISCQDEIADSGVFAESLLDRMIQECNLDIPIPSPLPGQAMTEKPYVFAADNAFPLEMNIMSPYPGDHTEPSLERTFNQNLSRARVVADNAFGVMSANFHVLRKPICLQPEKASNVVMACILLHNFLRKSRTSRDIYTPNGYMDRFENGEIIQGSWRNEELRTDTDGALIDLPAVEIKSTSEALEIRNNFAEYLSDCKEFKDIDKNY